MATKFKVNGKIQQRPGVYATTRSAIRNPPVNNSYSNILIIDDGIGSGFGGGSGVAGQFKSGSNSVYSFNTLQDFQAFVKGGPLWSIARPLFQPAPNQSGVGKVYFIQAKNSTASSISFTLANGAFSVSPLDEGVNANGVLTSGNLSKGYAAKLVRTNIPVGTPAFTTSTSQASGASLPQINKVTASNVNEGDTFSVTLSSTTVSVIAGSNLKSEVYTQLVAAINSNSTLSAVFTASTDGVDLILTAVANNTPFTQTSAVVAAPIEAVLQIWVGTYKGLDSINGKPYDGVTAELAQPILAAESPKFTAISSLISWMQNDLDFNLGFKLNSGHTATGSIVAGDLVTYADYNLAVGGTESYNVSNFDSALALVNNLDFTHIFATSYGLSATNLNNTKLFDFVKDGSKYDRYLVVAGGKDKATYNSQSRAASRYYDSEKVVVVHGEVKKTIRGNANFFEVHSQLYHAAAILGRCAGLPPQVPVTSKSIGIDGVQHQLSDAEIEQFITDGVMTSVYDTEVEAFVITLDVMTLQNNDYLINDDGTSYSWQLQRIKAELNKFIIVNGKKRFFDPNGLGGNRNTTSPEEVKTFIENTLRDRTADSQNDDLIISFRDVQTSMNQDNLYAEYKFIPNTEIKAIIATGVMIDGN